MFYHEQNGIFTMWLNHEQMGLKMILNHEKIGLFTMKKMGFFTMKKWDSTLIKPYDFMVIPSPQKKWDGNGRQNGIFSDVASRKISLRLKKPPISNFTGE